jgi:diguanylate cyclase (GGDEF)-like protein
MPQRDSQAHTKPDRALLFLSRLASEFTAVHPLPDLIDRVMLALHEETGFDSCALALLDERHPGTLKVQGASGLRARSRGVILPREKGLHGVVMASRMPLLVHDMWEDPRVHRRDGKIRSGIYAPLLVHDRAVGVLSAHRAEQRAFTESDLSLLTIVARYLTGAIEIARLHANLYDLAAKDALTRLANRRNFLDHLASEIARSRRGGHALSIVVLDLDGFGIINDVHGHATGDALLIHVAQTLTRSLRASDLAARLGSDEFGLLLPETNGAEAAKLISRLRTLVISIPRQRQASSRVSLSYGIATWSQDTHTPDSLLQEAESQLHARKHRPTRRAPKKRGREVAAARR